MMSRVLLLVVAVAASGCASYPWQKTRLYVNSGVALYREKKLSQGNQVALGYQHPIELSLEQTVLVLSQLVFRTDPLLRKPQTVHVFTDKEIRALAEPLALSLKAITPDERLRFLVIRSGWTDVVAGTRGTSGVIFRTTDGMLHLAFDKIQEQFQVAEGGDADEVPIATEPTTVVDGDPLVPGAGMVLHVGDKGTRYPRWIEIARIEDVKAAASPPPDPTKLPPAPPQEVVIPTRPQVDDAPPPKPQPAAAVQAAPTVPPAASTDEAKYQRVRSKLEQIKRLRQDGVISEEEYQKEYQKLLSEL